MSLLAKDTIPGGAALGIGRSSASMQPMPLTSTRDGMDLKSRCVMGSATGMYHCCWSKIVVRGVLKMPDSEPRARPHACLHARSSL